MKNLKESLYDRVYEVCSKQIPISICRSFFMIYSRFNQVLVVKSALGNDFIIIKQHFSKKANDKIFNKVDEKINNQILRILKTSL